MLEVEVVEDLVLVVLGALEAVVQEQLQAQCQPLEQQI
jgi:hypothetical protein